MTHSRTHTVMSGKCPERGDMGANVRFAEMRDGTIDIRAAIADHIVYSPASQQQPQQRGRVYVDDAKPPRL